MIATDRPGLENVLTPEGKARWHALQAAVGRVGPEPKLARDFWTLTDRLGHEPYASAIARFIRHRDTRSPLTIGIAAPWGAGKTSLMRMVQEDLDPRDASGKRGRIQLTKDGKRKLTKDAAGSTKITNERLLALASSPTRLEDETIQQITVESAEQPLDKWRPTVWFNPWMYATGEQVWAGLAHEIITQITQRLDVIDRENFWLRLNLRRIDGQLVRRRVYLAILERLLPIAILGIVLVLIVTGLSLLGQLRIAGGLAAGGGLTLAIAGVARVIGFLSQKASATFASLVTPPTSGPLATASLLGAGVGSALRDPDYESRLGLLYLVHTDMKAVLDLVATPERPLVVFVDDLDRCSPAAVAQVVEAINLFLAGQFPNCIFVIALEPGVVATHIEVAYKDLVLGLKQHQQGEWATLGWRFLDKIVQLPLRLPETAPENVATFISSLLLPAAAGSSKSEPPTESDEWKALVGRIADAIRAEGPGITQIDPTARRVQERLLGSGPEARLSPAARAAARVVLDQLFRDDNDEVRRVIVSGATALPGRNPREIKRFVNLFRFYAVISAERAFGGRTSPQLDQVAKLAVLAIRWPQLINLLLKPCPGGTWLESLEAAARQSPPDAAEPAWDNLVSASGLSGQLAVSPDGEAQDLRTFLANSIAIGNAVEGIF